MQYEGTLYRPPSEARSLIIQVTIGMQPITGVPSATCTGRRSSG